MDESRLEMELPGFRFHPTEEELLEFYLKNMVLGKKIRHIIGCLNIYRYDPWDLPGHAKVGEREWYFFVGRETRHGSGRPNRTTEKGFWKATGSDRKIYSLSNPNPNRMIGLKKTLVFYQGRAPHGSKTDWVMNEYRLPDSISSSSSHKNIVLCKIYRKATSIKVLEQRAAMEDDEYTIHNNAPIHNPQTFLTINNNKDAAKHTMLQLSHQFSNDNISVTTTSTTHTASSSSSSSLLLSLQSGEVKPSKLELPPKSDCWLQEQDPLWHQLRSPWLLNDFMPLTPLPNLHHF